METNKDRNKDLKNKIIKQALDNLTEVYLKDHQPQLSLRIAKILNTTGEYDSSNVYVGQYITYGDSISRYIEPPLLNQGLGFYGHRGRDLALSLMVENYISMDSLKRAEQIIGNFSADAYDIVEPHIATAKLNILRGDTALAQMHIEKVFTIQPQIDKTLQNDTLLSNIVNRIHEKFGRLKK